MTKGRKVKKLDRARKQFFQWYWMEELTIPEVKVAFDELSKRLSQVTGEEYLARLGTPQSNRSERWLTLSIRQ